LGSKGGSSVTNEEPFLVEQREIDAGKPFVESRREGNLDKDEKCTNHRLDECRVPIVSRRRRLIHWEGKNREGKKAEQRGIARGIVQLKGKRQAAEWQKGP